MDEARASPKKIGRFPLIIRPAFTLGGTGGGIAYNRDEFEEIAKRGIDLSPVPKSSSRNPSSAGRNTRWKSCATRPTTASSSAPSKTSIPWASTPATAITVAPIQTLTDKEYQIMRDQSFAVIRAVGVETGGSNIQFGVSPTTAAWSSSR
jgi:carbamoyl-phosphate synthase large subunit